MRHAKRFFATLLLVLCLLAIRAAAANIRFYVGPSGQTLYVRIENPGGNYVATALTEGTSGGAGNYTASEATIAALTGMNSPSTGAGCAYTIRVGTPSASADDPIVGCGDLAWSGSAELRTPVDTRQVAGTTQTAADLGLAVGTVQTRIGVPVGADLSADIAAKPTAAQIWAALTSGLSTSGSVGKLIVDNLDGKVSEAGGAGGSFTESERAQILAALSVGEETGVPTAQTWVIKRADGDMRATASIPKDKEEEIDVFADFRNVLPSGDAIKPTGGIVSVALINDGNTGTIDSDAFDSVANATLWMNAGVRFTISGGTAGQTDRVRVKVLTVGGKTISAVCEVNVKGG